MVDSNFYVENPSNSPMHYENKPLVGVIDFPCVPVSRPYNYFEAQAMYDTFVQDMQIKEHHANPNKFKKGTPKIIKIIIGALIAIPLIFMGTKGIKMIISKFKH